MQFMRRAAQNDVIAKHMHEIVVNDSGRLCGKSELAGNYHHHVFVLLSFMPEVSTSARDVSVFGCRKAHRVVVDARRLVGTNLVAMALRVAVFMSVPKLVALMSRHVNVFFQFQPRWREHIMRPYSTVKWNNCLRDLALFDEDVDPF